MSEYAKLPTKYRDRECLVAALGEMGYTNVEVHDIAQQLFDYHGRATTYVDKTGDKANIIVRRKFVGSAANDLGFAKQLDGTYSAIISAYDSGKHNTKWLTDLKKAYSDKITTKEAKRQHLTLMSQPKLVMRNGKQVKMIQYLAQ